MSDQSIVLVMRVPLIGLFPFFQSGTQPARHAHLRPTGVRNFPAPGFTSKIVLICRLGCRGIEGNVRTKLLVMVISASGIVKRGVLLAQSIVFMDVVGRPLRCQLHRRS